VRKGMRIAFTDTSMEDNSTFRNILIVDKPSVDPDHTDFPDVIPDYQHV
jgi:hypothetical protein